MSVFRLLRDYAQASPWLHLIFTEGHIVEVPFSTYLGNESAREFFGWVPWKPGEPIPISDCRPPYPYFIIIGPQRSETRQSFLLAMGNDRQSDGAYFDFREKSNFDDRWHGKLTWIVSLYAFNFFTPKQASSFPSLTWLSHFGFNEEDPSPVLSTTDKLVSSLTDEKFVERFGDIAMGAFTDRMDAASKRIFGYSHSMPWQNAQGWPNIMVRSLGTLASMYAATVTLLNCKNIVSCPVDPPPLNRAARRRGEQLPPYRYHVLKVRPFRSKSERSSQLLSDTAALQALHWVRGHPKIYTAAKPLLGKYVGQFWFQPHLAGRDKSRFVDKSYRIENDQRIKERV